MSPEELTRRALGAATEASLDATGEPMSSTQRVAKLRKDRTAAGLREVRGAWAYPEDHPDIKAHAAKLAARRQRREKREAG